MNLKLALYHAIMEKNQRELIHEISSSRTYSFHDLINQLSLRYSLDGFPSNHVTVFFNNNHMKNEVLDVFFHRTQLRMQWVSYFVKQEKVLS